MTLPILVGNLSAIRIKTRLELNQLAPEWNNLLRQSAADSIFLTWEWISSWLNTVSPSASLVVIAVRDDEGSLVAIAPFYCSSLRFFNLINYRCLRVLGDCHSGGEYQDIIVLPSIEDKALSAVAKAIASLGYEWDCAWIPNIAGWTGAAERLTKGFGHAHGFLRKRACSFSALKLPETWPEYKDHLSSNRRSALQRQEKRLTQAGVVTILKCEQHEALPQFLEALFDLHRKRWQQVGQEGSFARRPRMLAFYKDFAPKALANGWLALFSLTINDTLHAAQYGYIYNNAFLQLQEGYDPAGPNGSGNVLRAEIFRSCMEKGLQEYDFLGEHTQHKANWGAMEREGWQIFLGRDCYKNILLRLFEVWPTGRFLRQHE